MAHLRPVMNDCWHVPQLPLLLLHSLRGMFAMDGEYTIITIMIHCPADTMTKTTSTAAKATA